MGYNFFPMKFFQKNRFLEENDGDPDSVRIGNFFVGLLEKGLKLVLKNCKEIRKNIKFCWFLALF
jgi:hypothetical protein